MSHQKFKHFESETGQILYSITIDGYEVGDRLLEGVMFIVTVQSNGTLAVKVHPDAQEYFEDLNKEKWLKEIAEHVQEADEIFMENGDMCWLVEDEV